MSEVPTDIRGAATRWEETQAWLAEQQDRLNQHGKDTTRLRAWFAATGRTQYRRIVCKTTPTSNLSREVGREAG